MDRGSACCKIQLIDQDKEFNERGLQNFMKTTDFLKCDRAYSIVAILGPQSSGKSTLMNHLFRTNFAEMDAYQGRNQTTKGIWIEKCTGMEPFTIAMDLEGSDSRERGEDDTSFEKQSALFALAIADVVLINMWYNDIGRLQAAGNLLLKAVFQVMMRLFSPRNKKTLLFVIRDHTKTPTSVLGSVLGEDIQKIWDGIAKPEAYKSATLDNFFILKQACFPSYEKEEQFKEKVAAIRRWISETLAGDKQEAMIPASGFSLSAQKIWKTIKENKDLDLPAHKVMIATFRCEDIANEKLKLLASDKGWLTLKEVVEGSLVYGLGEKLVCVLRTYISEYEKETAHYDEGVRTAKKQLLISKALDVVRCAYDTNVGHLHTKTLESFKTKLTQLLIKNKGEGWTESDKESFSACEESCMLDFDNGCQDGAITEGKWDSSNIKEKLRSDIKAHTLSALSTKLSEMEANSKVKQDGRYNTSPGYWLGVAGDTVSLGARIVELVEKLISLNT